MRLLEDPSSSATPELAIRRISEGHALDLICGQLWLTLSHWENESHPGAPATIRVAVYQPRIDGATMKMFLTHYASEENQPPFSYTSHIAFAPNEGTIGVSWTQKQTLTVPYGSADHRFSQSAEDHRIGSLLATPVTNLNQGGGVLAIISIDADRPGFFPPDGTPEARDLDRVIAPFRDLMSIVLLGQRLLDRGLEPVQPAGESPERREAKQEPAQPMKPVFVVSEVTGGQLNPEFEALVREIVAHTEADEADFAETALRR